MTHPDDPRMKGFKRRAEVADVLRLLEERVRTLAPQRTPAKDACGRTLAEGVTAPCDVPGFDRAAMDGYAVRGEDTFGATEFAPVVLRAVGSSVPGENCIARVERGQCVLIMTGAPMPENADAVLMAEDARADGETVHATAAVPPGKNVSVRGEDIRAGDRLFEPGRRLRPQDVGVLAAAGVEFLLTDRRPTVAVFATGNELLPPGLHPRPPKVVDANSPMLAALVERDGGVLTHHERLPDHADIIREKLEAAQADVILVSGGSSVGAEDYVPQVIGELGELAIHGVAMRPSSPAGVGFIGASTVFLLPGNPVSCLCAYDFFAGPTIRFLAGRSRDWPYARVDLPLARKITSEAGRVDYARVRVVDGKVEPLMVSGAGILSSTTRADGFVIVPRDAEGIPEGATVTVYLYG